jgi:GMP synthase-like glutamine amidotransferase
MSKRALVFQHMDDEPPGLFGEFLAARGYACDVVMLHRGEAIPALAPYDFLLVMGGAMDVWETDAYPWLADEISAIRDWVTQYNRPYFGVCLGLQLLTLALGGSVGLARGAEVGIGRIQLTALGTQHPMTAGLPQSMRFMQWHHAEVKRLPERAAVLAGSAVCQVQIMAVGTTMLATQFHGELTPALITRWAHIPQYIQWLEAALGQNAYDRVRAKALPLMPEFAARSRIMFENLVTMQALRRAA